MQWFDPQFWSDEVDYGKNELLELAKHFEEPLAFVLFNPVAVTRVWKSFKNLVCSYYAKIPSAKDLWKSVMSYRREEFPNLCTSGLNSQVERTFSTVTSILSDRCLSMTHNTLNESPYHLWKQPALEQRRERGHNRTCC